MSVQREATTTLCCAALCIRSAPSLGSLIHCCASLFAAAATAVALPRPRALIEMDSRAHLINRRVLLCAARLVVVTWRAQNCIHATHSATLCLLCVNEILVLLVALLFVVVVVAFAICNYAAASLTL